MRISDWSSDVCSSDLIYEKTDKFMLPGDFIAMKMTGEICTTYSGLSEGILWDFQKEQLAQSLLDHYDINHGLVSEPKATFSIQGRLTADRKSVVVGKECVVRVDRGGRRMLKKKKK